MELLQLRYFRTAAKLQNFSKAAELHMIPQPAISKTIHKLEEELGCPLFDRQGKKVYLNDAGEAFLKYVDQALNQIDKGIDAVANFQPALRLYAQSGIRFVPQLTADYWLASNRSITQVSYGDITVKKERYDVTFMHPLEDMSAYEYRTLMEDSIVLAVSPKHPFASRTEISVQELSDVPLVGFDRYNPLRLFIDAFLAEHHVVPRYAFESPDSYVVRSMITNGAGAGLVPCISWQQTPSNTVLIPLKEKKTRALVIASPEGQTFSKAALQFCEFACEWFARLSEEYAVNA